MLVVRKNKYEELENLRRKTNALRLLEGILIGLAIGALLALFLTPWDGQENRRYFKGQMADLKDRCRGMWGKCCGGDEEDFEDEDVLED